MTADVPRRAAFDDLRLGQWVARITGYEETVIGGVIVQIDEERGAASTKAYVTRAECERGSVTILRDPPAAPVTVRREDYDALVEAMDEMRGVATDLPYPLATAARALIDNADTGTDA